MLATPLRKNVDDLWNRVWSSGVTNPLAVVDYLTGLLLLRVPSLEKNWLADVRSAAASGNRELVTRLMTDVMRSFGLSVPDAALWAGALLFAQHPG